MDVTTLNDYVWLIALVAVWELVWKGMALWKAARAGDKAWYVVMLIINSVGILPIVYLLLGRDKSKET
jgi:hypothetical protein